MGRRVASGYRHRNHGHRHSRVRIA
jgi:hypothetical protein